MVANRAMKLRLFFDLFFGGAIKHKVRAGTITGHTASLLGKKSGAAAFCGACRRDFNRPATFVSN